ncbi:MAG: hypothetical protein K2K64_10560, partial [Muribaculaceae bacterium]|nr:hypothetical protein [Muribaculaceae bacterium]
TLDVFVAGSVVYIFVDEKWSTSIRVYPNDREAVGAEAFSNNGSVLATQLGAWQLKSDGAAGVDMIPFAPGMTNDRVDVVTLDGMLLKRGVSHSEATAGLEKGIYLVGGRKVIVR